MALTISLMDTDNRALVMFVTSILHESTLIDSDELDSRASSFTISLLLPMRSRSGNVKNGKNGKIGNSLQLT